MSIETQKNPIGVIEAQIQHKLTEQFSPQWLVIKNESYMHHSGKGAESHFKITLVAKDFEGQRAVARHRAVYACLAEQIAQGVHALALHLYTPNEWQLCEGVVPASPNCAGIGH